MTAALPIFLFVFRRREMRGSAKPAIRLRIGGRVETVEPVPPKNKKEVIFGERASINRQPLTGLQPEPSEAGLIRRLGSCG